MVNWESIISDVPFSVPMMTTFRVVLGIGALLTAGQVTAQPGTPAACRVGPEKGTSLIMVNWESIISDVPFSVPMMTTFRVVLGIGAC